MQLFKSIYERFIVDNLSIITKIFICAVFLLAVIFILSFITIKFNNLILFVMNRNWYDYDEDNIPEDDDWYIVEYIDDDEKFVTVAYFKDIWMVFDKHPDCSYRKDVKVTKWRELPFYFNY